MAAKLATYVRLGTVLMGAERWSNANINPTYRGQVLLQDGSVVQAFIKDLGSRQLANEVFAAALALAVGLPVPTPIIALVDQDIFPASAFPAGHGRHLVFASADAAAPTVVQIVAGGASASPVLRHLATWADLGRVYGFDSWVANIDRHANNLLLSGAGAVWLIDHGHCFTGPSWAPATLAPSQEYPNRLKDWMTPALTDEQRARAAGRAAAVAMEFSEGDIRELGAANFAEDFLGEDFSAAVQFLAARIPYVEQLASKALGVLV